MYKARVKKEKIPVKIQTLQHRIEGNVHLLVNTRITDILNQEGNHFIVFPELCVTGFECPENCTMHREQAEPVPGPATER
ncbi:MAG: hypothetical protein ACE5NJ_09655, partial [Thermodesulfobacteriota bacterium]